MSRGKIKIVIVQKPLYMGMTNLAAGKRRIETYAQE